jgi:hypothetical protein
MTTINQQIPGNTLASMQERNEQTLTDIQNLQKIEQDLYETLAKNIKANTITPQEKQKAISKINEISQMRINLYANLKDIYAFFQKNVSSSRTTLDEQKMAIDIVENELNQSKRKLKMLEDETFNKLKMVEINTYYGKSYNAHAGLMKSIALFCIPILILSILINRGIFPQGVGTFLIAIIIIWAIIYIAGSVIDMMNRDNMDYDEYNWQFNPNTAPNANTLVGPNVDPWASISPLCMGSECCIDGSTYDATQNLCVPNNTCANTTVTSTATVSPASPANLSNTLSSTFNAAQNGVASALSSGGSAISTYSNQFTRDVSSLF